MRQRGFTYLAVLFLVAIMGAVLAATATVWHTLAQRDKEQELLCVGHEFRRAIGLYYERTPGTAKQFPKTLDDLLDDKRQTNLARYLRKRYIDPLSTSAEWGTVPGPGGSIMGVYSRAVGAPIKSGNFDEDDKEFAGATSYADWKFVYAPKRAAAPATPALAPKPAALFPPASPPVAGQVNPASTAPPPASE